MSNVQRIEATAWKIVSIKTEEDGGATIALDSPLCPITRVDAEYVANHQPVAGGYYVYSADGYKSYLPAEAIENASA